MSDKNIFTKDNCVGCNLCISNCPCAEANVVLMENGIPRVHVDPQKCIKCGQCLRSCIHKARDYVDDTEDFLKDLEGGKKIALIAAPALRSNVRDWPRLLAYLKSIGVRAVFDTSFGADICTWAHLRYLSESKAQGIISQPCPAIVNYIEHYIPELLSRLAPIQSPAMCMAVYMKNYKKIPGSYAFLSPCLAKGDEFKDPNTGGLIEYNVTFRKLLESLAARGVDFSEYAPAQYDNEAHGLGSVYPSPGGLKTNVEQHIQGQWIYQAEGQPHISHFLHEYAKERRELPFLVDVLSCLCGCNSGPGACLGEEDDYAISRTMEEVKKETLKNKSKENLPPGPDFAQFDRELNLSDFKRQYTPKRITKTFVDRHELEQAFMALHKPSHEFRTKECGACGYSSCEEMAAAVAKGINVIENCVEYNKSVVKKHREAALEILEKNKNEISLELKSMLEEIAGLDKQRGEIS